MAQREADLTAICDLCAQVISPDDGYLWIDNDEVAKVTQQVAAWEAEHPADEVMTAANLMTRPEPARWRVTHTACEPGAPEDRYDIALDRILTFRDLAGWTLHLMQKSWLGHTDWNELADGALGGHTGRITSRFDEQWDG